MEYFKNKKTGVIYVLRGYGYYNGAENFTLQARGSKRTVTIRKTYIDMNNSYPKSILEKYKPGFFEKIKLFFEFI